MIRLITYGHLCAASKRTISMRNRAYTGREQRCHFLYNADELRESDAKTKTKKHLFNSAAADRISLFLLFIFLLKLEANLIFNLSRETLTSWIQKKSASAVRLVRFVRYVPIAEVWYSQRFSHSYRHTYRTVVQRAYTWLWTWPSIKIPVRAYFKCVKKQTSRVAFLVWRLSLRPNDV